MHSYNSPGDGIFCLVDKYPCDLTLRSDPDTDLQPENRTLFSALTGTSVVCSNRIALVPAIGLNCTFFSFFVLCFFGALVPDFLVFFFAPPSFSTLTRLEEDAVKGDLGVSSFTTSIHMAKFNNITIIQYRSMEVIEARACTRETLTNTAIYKRFWPRNIHDSCLLDVIVDLDMDSASSSSSSTKLQSSSSSSDSLSSSSSIVKRDRED
mmetsp:Transcript_23418/g.42252  ORF Transcript_23418/g.42252 Transcript_23418/m.42252 type:complete len:209 (+) Transcript_23418:935-1561(+)